MLARFLNRQLHSLFHALGRGLGQERTKLARHLAGALGAFPRGRREHALNQTAQLRGHGCKARDVQGHERALQRGLEGGLSRECLEEHSAQGEDIRGIAQGLAPSLLGRHVAGRAEPELAHAGTHAGDAEIHEARVARHIHEDVPRRDIAVEDPEAAVRVVERFADLCAEVGYDDLCQGPFGAQLGQGDALHVLHGQVVGALRGEELVHRHDVGVAEGDEGVGFPHEHGHKGWIARKLSAHLLDDERLFKASESAQARLEYPGHPALGELFVDEIRSDLSKHGVSPRMIVNARPPHLSLLALFVLGSACTAEDTGVRQSTIALRYLPGCAPARVDALQVEALGDFALRPAQLGSLAFPGEQGALSPQALRALPVDTALFRITLAQAAYRGVAIFSPVPEASSREALLLPLGQACAISELAPVAAARGAVAFAGAGLVAAGAAQVDGAVGTRLLLRAALETPKVTHEDAGFFVPRILSTALGVGEEAWFIGGAAEARDGTRALDTFERVDGKSVLGLGRLVSGRVAPQAVRLPDGAVLVGGGRERVGRGLLPSFERIAPGATDAQLLESVLPVATEDLVLRVRDDGVVWIGASLGAGFRSFELDVNEDGLSEQDAPALAAGATLWLAGAAALPGARVLVPELREGLANGAAWIFAAAQAPLRIAAFLPSFAGVSPRATAGLPDGRVLLVGARGSDGEAWQLDVGRGTADMHGLPFGVDTLLPRNDGSVLGLGEMGAWLLREDGLTPFDHPGGTLLADDVARLALSAAAHFAREGLALIATVDGARLDLAGLTFADMHLQVRVSGQAELLLLREDGTARGIGFGAGTAGPVLCTLPWADGESVQLRRRGSSVRLDTATHGRDCVLDGMEGHLRVAMRLMRGSRVEDLRIERE
jgi:hypothetical protein